MVEMCHGPLRVPTWGAAMTVSGAPEHSASPRGKPTASAHAVGLSAILPLRYKND